MTPTMYSHRSPLRTAAAGGLQNAGGGLKRVQLRNASLHPWRLIEHEASPQVELLEGQSFATIRRPLRFSYCPLPRDALGRVRLRASATVKHSG